MNEEQEAESLMGEEDITYEEILANLYLNDELIITIPAEQEVQVKTGIKNCKTRQNKKQIAEGMPADQNTLEFLTFPSEEFEGCIQLKVILKARPTIRVKKIVIPSDNFD